MAPIFFDYERTPLGLKKVHIALDFFNTYLKNLGKKYAAAEHVTIADFPLITATMTLEAIGFDFSKYNLVRFGLINIAVLFLLKTFIFLTISFV